MLTAAFVSTSSCAAADRLGSRGKAVAALERGKIFVNDEEAGIADAARRLAAGDAVRVWVDRPGSAKARPRTGPTGELDVVYEDDALVGRQQAAGDPVGAARAQPGRAVRLRAN